MYAGVVLGGMEMILGAFWGGLMTVASCSVETAGLPYRLQNTAIFIVFR